MKDAQLFRLRNPLLLTAIVSALMASPAIAEDDEAEKDRSEETVEHHTLENLTMDRMIVTARFREEALNRVPLSIKAFTSEEMERTGIRNVRDIIEQTPNVTYDSIGGMASGAPVIRGLAQPGLVGDETNVAVFIDGIYASGRDAIFLPFDGLQRVEVVRGPQSALYGRNAFAGAINYITKPPSHELETGVNTSIGTDGMYNAHFYLSGPLTDRFRARLDLSDSSTGSTVRNKNTITGERIDGRRLGEMDNQFARLGLVYEFDNTSINLAHTYIDTKESPRATAHVQHNGGFPVRNAARDFGVLLNGTHVTFNPVTGQWELLGDWVFTGDPQKYLGVVDHDLWKASFTGVAPEATGTERTVNRTSLVIDHSFDAFSVTYLGGYNTSDYTINLGQLKDYPGMVILPTFVAENLPPPSAFPDAPEDLQVVNLPFGTVYSGVRGYDLGGQPNDDRKEYSHELRFNGNFNNIDWSFGGYYSKLELDQQTTIAIVGTDSFSSMIFNAAGTGFETHGLTTLQGTKYETTTKSAFAAIGFNITDQLRMNLEGRYTSEDKDADNYADNRAPGVLFPTGKMSGSWSYFTPRVTLDWAANDNTIYYLNIGKGAKSGGLNGGAEGDEMTFDPETNWTYEIGTKTSLFDNRLSLNVAAYFIDWDDQQVRGFSTLGEHENVVPAVIVTNLGKTEVKGLELDGRWQINHSFGLNFGAAYNDAEVKRGILGPEFGYLDYEAQGLNPTVYPASQTLPIVSTIPPFFGVVGVMTLPPPGTLVSDGDVSGKKLPRQSRVTLNASIDHIRDRGSVVSFTRLGVNYRSRQYLDPTNTTELPSAYTVNFITGVERGPMRINFFVNNLTNEKTPSGGYRKFIWNGNPQFVVEPRMGRMYGIDFSYRFR